MSDRRAASDNRQITVGIIIVILAAAAVISWAMYSKSQSTPASTNTMHTSKIDTERIYAEYIRSNTDAPDRNRRFMKQLTSKLNNLRRVEIIEPKAGSHAGHYLVDMNPDDALVVGTIRTNSKDFDSFKKELGFTLKTAGKRKIIRGMLSNTWIRMIFDDGTFVLAMFFTHEDDFIIHDNKPKGSTVEPVYIHCQSTARLRKLLLDNMDRSHVKP